MTTRLVLAFVLAATTMVGVTPTQTTASHPIPHTAVVQSGLTVPWDVAFAPDGTMFVTERPGTVRAYASGQPGAALVATTTVELVRSEHEAGVNGIAVDRDYASNRFVYVCAARDADGSGGPAPWVNEVLRYRVTPALTLVEPHVVLTGALANRQHNGCAVEMDAAGLLWVSIGDAATPALAQDPTSLNGKILRMHADGTPPADNPVFAGATERTVVYSIGHRNPQGIGFSPSTGAAYASEHGPNVNDEINRIVAGANYGWPCYTGDATPFQPSVCDDAPASAFAAPAWSSGGATIATSGLAFLDHAMWDGWNGSAMVAQLKERDLRRFVPDGSGAVMTQADLLLDGQYGRLRAAVQSPDGALYVTTSNGTDDRVLRIAPGPVTVDRLAGSDRYATAAQVSRHTFPAGTPTVYVATGRDYPDALAGGAAAARDRGPVLLVTAATIPAATAEELVRLRPNRIVVLGGTGVISTSVESALARYASAGTVRMAGRDRFETAATISRSTFAPWPPVAYIATGHDYPDALTGVPAAGLQGGPILLVTRTAIPSATGAELERLLPQRIVVLGGSAVVSNTVWSQLQQYTPSGVVRLSGDDRYATALAVSRAAFPSGARHVFIATGRDYPDGLTGGAAAAFRGGPLLLVPGTSVPDEVGVELQRLDPDRVTILGGPGVVSDEVRAQIDALLNP